MPRLDDEQAIRKHLKVFAGGLPPTASDPQVGHHFARYGHVLSANVVPPREGGQEPYAFCTFKFAADADCAVVDTQHFPGAHRPLQMGFARPRDDEGRKDRKDDDCKVFVGGIGDRDSEEEVGDFFSQWGLVILVYRGEKWSFVTYATKEAASRIMDESSVIYQRRRLDIKAPDEKHRRRMDERERQDLIGRAIARHFHKKSTGGMPPHGMHPGAPPPGYPAPGAYPGYPPPGGGHPGAAPPPGPYGAPPPGYPPHGAPPPGYPAHGAPPPGYPPAAYGPQGAPPPGYPTPGYPPPSGYYAGAPPAGGYYGAPGEAPPPAEAHKPLPALPAPEHAQPPPAAAPQSQPYGRDPYARPDGGAPAHGSAPPPGPGGAPPPSAYGDYYRDSRGGEPRREEPPREGYYRAAEDPYAARPPPSSYAPGVDPYANSAPPQPSHSAYAGQPGGHDARYRPY